MSLFKRTASQVEALEASLQTFLSDDSAPIESRKTGLTTLQNTYNEILPVVQKFVSKADAGEADPYKRLYGASMVTKIRAVNTTLSQISTQLDDAAASIDPLYEQFVAARDVAAAKKLEAERLEREQQDEQQRLEEQKLRQQEQARIENERQQREQAQREAEQAAAKKREEEERQRKLAAQAEAERLRAEEAAKKEAEEKEQQQKRLAAEQAEKERNAAAVKESTDAMNITIKTSKGKSLPLSAASPATTVADLKQLVEQQHSIPAETQRLIFQGRLLDDSKTIGSYKIAAGCAVHLVEKQKPAASSAPTTKPVVPPGTVCNLTNGSQEFSRISASCVSRVLLVDWSASWCAPCRAITPAFERLANRFPDVTFVKVDIEASPANSQLAAQKGISSYPTFHFYIDGVIVHQLSGASASTLEAGIKRTRTMAVTQQQQSSRAAPSAPSTPAPTSYTLTSRVFAALDRLKNNVPRADFITAVRTLLTFVRNVVNHPGQEKYRKVRTANAAFQTRLASKTGGVECMYAFGFEPRMENGENFLILPAEAAANPELGTIKTQLEQALSVHSGSAAPGGAPSTTPAPTPAPAPTQPTPSPSPFGAGGGMGGMGGMGDMPNAAMINEMMADPAIMQIAQDIIADPEATAALMEVQTAMANGDYAAVQQLQNNPALARIQQAFETNPDLLANMLRFMTANGGLPNMPGMGGMPGMGAQNGAGMQPPTNTGGTGGAFQQTPNATAAPPHIPGAPTTAEEEDRLLQEAIRLSMQDSAAKQRRDEQPKKDEGGSGGQN